MKNYNHFPFSETWWTTLQEVDASTREAVVSAICAYAFDGVNADGLHPLAQGLYIAFKAALEADKAKFNDVRSKRSEAGKASALVRKERREQQIQQVLTNSTSAEGVNTTNKTNTCQQTQPINIIDNTLYSLLPLARTREEKKKKEDFFIEIIKEMLRRGASEPKNEAERFWEYNEQAGWLQANGRAVKNPVAWSRKWNIQTGINEDVRRYADMYIDMLGATGMRDDEEMLDAFGGIEEDSSQMKLMFKTKHAKNKFMACEADDSKFELLKAVCSIHFPNKNINYICKR